MAIIAGEELMEPPVVLTVWKIMNSNILLFVAWIFVGVYIEVLKDR
jgi:hypothetical protein